jgi:hypothetical protein
MEVTSTKFGRLEVNCLYLGSGVGRAIWEQFTFGCFRNLEILHGLPSVAAYMF